MIRDTQYMCGHRKISEANYLIFISELFLLPTRRGERELHSGYIPSNISLGIWK